MIQTNSLGGYVAMLGLMVLMGLVGLMLLGPALESGRGGTISIASPQQAVSTEWLEGQNAEIARGLTINSHAEKHGTDAWEIYKMLLAGRCAASVTFCGGSEIEKMHICIDPVTGVAGAIIQFGDEIMTGYFTPADPGYWKRRVARESWEVCDD